jgi:hypothetical protein
MVAAGKPADRLLRAAEAKRASLRCFGGRVGRLPASQVALDSVRRRAACISTSGAHRRWRTLSRRRAAPSSGRSSSRPFVEQRDQGLALAFPQASHRTFCGADVCKCSVFAVDETRCEPHPLGVQVLARELRKAVDLRLQRFVHPTVAVAEVDCGVPHLKIEVGRPMPVVEIAAVAASEELGVLGVVNRVAVRANSFLQGEQAFVASGTCRGDAHGAEPQASPRPRPASYKTCKLLCAACRSSARIGARLPKSAGLRA